MKTILLTSLSALMLSAATVSACTPIPNTNAYSCTMQDTMVGERPPSAPVVGERPASTEKAPVVDTPETKGEKLGRLNDRRDKLSDRIGKMKDRRGKHEKGSDKRKELNGKINNAKEKRDNVDGRIDRTQQQNDKDKK